MSLKVDRQLAGSLNGPARVTKDAWSRQSKAFRKSQARRAAHCPLGGSAQQAQQQRPHLKSGDIYASQLRF